MGSKEKLRIVEGKPSHASLHYKKIKEFRSVRVGLSYRALGIESGSDIVWFWIGSHADYDKIIS